MASDVYEEEPASTASIDNEQFYLMKIWYELQLRKLEFPDVDYIGSKHLRQGKLARVALSQFTLSRTIVFYRAHP